jgi:uncharacterized protein (DUF736 family)
MKIITEETEVKFEKYTDLSYLDEGEPEVTLYVNDMSVGYIKVWKDIEQDGREYICVNYEVIYLDTIDKFEL